MNNRIENMNQEKKRVPAATRGMIGAIVGLIVMAVFLICFDVWVTSNGDYVDRTRYLGMLAVAPLYGFGYAFGYKKMAGWFAASLHYSGSIMGFAFIWWVLTGSKKGFLRGFFLIMVMFGLVAGAAWMPGIPMGIREIRKERKEREIADAAIRQENRLQKKAERQAVREARAEEKAERQAARAEERVHQQAARAKESVYQQAVRAEESVYQQAARAEERVHQQAARAEERARLQEGRQQEGRRDVMQQREYNTQEAHRLEAEDYHCLSAAEKTGGVVGGAGNRMREAGQMPVQPQIPPMPLPGSKLLCFGGEFAGGSFDLANGKELVIGRDPTRSNIVIPGSDISRAHCMIRYDNAAHCGLVKDISSNGTSFLDGTPVPKDRYVRVESGNGIRIGSNGPVFLFQ